MSSSLVGPRSVSRVNQVAIPVALMRLLGLSPGDQVYFEAVEGAEPEVRIVPARTVERRYTQGRRPRTPDTGKAGNTTS